MSLQSAEQALTVNFVNVCSVTLLAYDTFLNIEDELKFIWRKEWTFVKCVYIALKYLAFVDGTLTIYFLLQTDLQPKQCMSVYMTIVYVMWAGVLLAEVILQCHAWALWGLSRYVLVYLMVTDLLVVSLSFLVLFHSFGGIQFLSPSPLPMLRTCFPEKLTSGKAVYISYVCLITVESNILILMLWKGFVEWRGSKIALVHILYRDGMVYIFSMIVISVANLLFVTVQDGSMYWMLLSEAQRIGHAILAARLVLNVRSCAERSQEGNLQSGDEDVMRARQIISDVVRGVSTSE
ncbi:hypothetical protein SCHPADRAFT_635878 [Schizopora paradoxa]|uniref:DUF6533 domain-containing protein n=1 Tax=Schizopora paradoxa TaxID=27342 RepID=A0A0H2R7D3_9AGAM|nr:hypothetical protein SCHPADRAFT_635878 [Schizopora paradoxa]